MNWPPPSRERIDRIREKYPDGTRVRFMGFGTPDPYTKLKPGTEGTVGPVGVDDAGTVHIKWDNGSSLGMLVLEGDRIELVKGDESG